jgi:hypothetical protein
MRRIIWLLAPVAAVSLAVGVAVAGSQSSETSPVTADFEARLVKEKERTCDSNHTEFRVRFEGSQTSSDARLTGDLEVKVRSVVNTQNGRGSTFGTVTVREPGGGQPKFHGQVVGVLEPDGGNEGFLAGRTVAKPHVHLLANFNVQQDLETGAITGEFGKDSQSGPSQDPAILTNACRGGQRKHGGHERHGSRHDDGGRQDGGGDD